MNLSSISYESGTVKLEVTHDDALTARVVDIIELDGTVFLSPDVANRTVDTPHGKLNGSVLNSRGRSEISSWCLCVRPLPKWQP